MTGIGVPGMFAFARSVQTSGKSVIAVVPKAHREPAEQRERADRDGERRQARRRVTRKPLKAPQTRADEDGRSRAASSNGSPALRQDRRSSRLESPTMLATDRSISSVMMMSVIGRAISRIGAMSRRR